MWIPSNVLMKPHMCVPFAERERERERYSRRQKKVTELCIRYFIGTASVPVQVLWGSVRLSKVCSPVPTVYAKGTSGG